MPPDAVSQHDQDQLLRRLRDMEARARSLERQLEASDRLAAVGVLAAGLAHEFNNLLTPLAGVARLALDDPADADLARRAFETALAAADRGGRLADSILTLAGDALSPTPRPSDTTASVAQAIQGALSCVVRDPARDNIRVRVDADSALVAAIPQPALRQVLLNLILNALQAMRSAGGELTIAASRSTWNTGHSTLLHGINSNTLPPSPLAGEGGSRSEPGEGSCLPPPSSEREPRRGTSRPPSPLGAQGRGAGSETMSASRDQQSAIRIVVSDTGPGVPADMLPHIFEPFVTASTAEPDRPCAGLGLAICRRLILAAHGDIAAENAQPAGARFTITLPEA